MYFRFGVMDSGFVSVSKSNSHGRWELMKEARDSVAGERMQVLIRRLRASLVRRSTSRAYATTTFYPAVDRRIERGLGI